jgi:anti-anti-sigma factor
MGEFEVHNEVRGEVRIVSIHGEFDLGVADRVRPVLSAAAADPLRALVVDLVPCAFIDSTGLAMILGETRPLRNGQSTAAIASPDGSDVRRVLDLMGVPQSLPTFDTVEEAVEAAVRPG